MPAPVLRAQELDKAYGERRLFEDATFQVEEGDHVAVVGGNGAGKSTLLRILAGRERPDAGFVELRAGARLHWFDQHPSFEPEATVADVLAAPLPVPAHLANELAELERRIADPALYEDDGYQDVLDRYNEVQRQAQQAITPSRSEASNALADELGLTPEMRSQDVASLSGGQRTRVFLARVLAPVRDGDLLVLDEPTNHLDVETIEWLEGHLASLDVTLLVVAHDRLFLDNVADRVLEVAGGRVHSYPGNYTDFLALRDQRRETQARERERVEREIAQTKAVLQQFRHQKRFDGQMASRKLILEKYQAALARTPDPVIERLAFALRFDAVQKSTPEVITATGLLKSFGSQPVLDRADLVVVKGDRIGLVGPNGAGKSTLLKILARRTAPDGGHLRIPPGVKDLYYSQERDDLDLNGTVQGEVRSARPSLKDDDVKALVGRFRFNPEVDLPRRVSTLSGGERARLALLKTILSPSNLLLLDEPTNHLDLVAREVVAHALNAYHGTLIIVSHDRFLLDSVTTKTAVLNRGQVVVHQGGFTATRHLHRSAASLPRRRDRYVVTKGFKDWSTGERFAFGRVVELAPEELEEIDLWRRALQNGWIRRDD